MTGRATWLLDAAALGALALLVRLPYLQRIPRFTDEVKEISWALAIYRGEHLPLAAHNGYSGPLWNYLLAGLFALLGPSPALPRAVVALGGAATIVATYSLARLMGGRPAGAVAGLLAAVSTVPVLLNSHVAWSVCVTPLLATLAATAVWLGVERQRGAMLAVGAVLVAMTAQAHPLGVLLAPALALWLLSRPQGRALLRGPWALIAIAAGVAGYANMVAYHVSSRLETVGRALEKLSDGVPGETTVAGAARTALDLARNMGEILIGQANRSLVPGTPHPDALVVAALAVAVVVLVYAALRGQSLPLFVVATTVVLMPLVNTQYGFPLGARYLSFLLPFVYAAAGFAAGDMASAAARRGRRWQALAAAAVAVALVLHGVLHLAVLRHTYRSELASGRTNDLVLAIARRAADEQARNGSGVLLSELIEAKFSGGGHLHRVLAALLGLSEVDYELVEEDLDGVEEQLAACGRGCVLLLSDGHASALRDRYRLQPVAFPYHPLPEDGEGYGMYRLMSPRRAVEPRPTDAAGGTP